MYFKEAIKFLKTYSGKSTVHYFIKAADRAFQLCRPEDHGCLFIYILNGLEEKEPTAIGNRDFQSYTDLRSFLTGKFVNPGGTNLIKISSKFSTLKQGVYEEATNYYDRAIAMRRKIDEIANNSGYSQIQVINAAHKELITCFIQGLRSPTTRSRLYESKPASLEVVLEELENWDEFNQGSEDESQFGNPIRVIKETSSQGPTKSCPICFNTEHTMAACPEFIQTIQIIVARVQENRSNDQDLNNSYNYFRGHNENEYFENSAYSRRYGHPQSNQQYRVRHRNYDEQHYRDANYRDYPGRSQRSYSQNDQRCFPPLENRYSPPQPRLIGHNNSSNCMPASTQGKPDPTNEFADSAQISRSRNLRNQNPVCMWFNMHSSDGMKVKVLFDTGASVSVMGRSVANKLGHNFISCDEIALIGLGNHKVPNYGIFPYTFFAGKTPISGNFRIIDDEAVSDFDIFFGMDLIHKYCSLVDWDNRLIGFGNKFIPFFVDNEYSHKIKHEQIRRIKYGSKPGTAKGVKLPPSFTKDASSANFDDILPDVRRVFVLDNGNIQGLEVHNDNSLVSQKTQSEHSPSFTKGEDLRRHSSTAIIDEGLILKIISVAHGAMQHGHRGINATVHAIDRIFNISNLKKRVTEFIAGCKKCHVLDRSHRNNNYHAPPPTTRSNPFAVRGDQAVPTDPGKLRRRQEDKSVVEQKVVVAEKNRGSSIQMRKRHIVDNTANYTISRRPRCDVI